MKKWMCIITLIIIVSNLNAQNTNIDNKYIKVTEGFLMVLNQGDNIYNEIEKMIVNENIPSANFTGFGFVNITFGFFNFKTKKYKPKTYNNMELTAMNGSIAWQNGKPSIHAHGTVTGKNFKAYGGHILSGTVSTGSVEILVTVHDIKLERKLIKPLGANVLCISNCNQ